MTNLVDGINLVCKAVASNRASQILAQPLFPAHAHTGNGITI